MTSSMKRTLLAAALLAAMPMGAPALSVSDDGVGQVLIYPYYTVNDGQATLISIVNSADRGKALKVRFREGRHGAVVQSFNLYLAAHDTWAAAVVASAGDDSAARIATTDTSCTVPQFVTLPFVDTGYTGANRDHPTSQATLLGALSRTREGYVEVMEMGTLQTGTAPTQLAEEATALASGIPSDCGAFVEAWQMPAGGWARDAAMHVGLPTGGLYGNASIVDVADGTMLSVDATALTRFYTNEAAPGSLHAPPDAERPTLASADSGGGRIVVEFAPQSRFPAFRDELPFDPVFPDAVSIALTRYRIENDFDTEPGTASATEWVITLPTKRAYTNVDDDAQVRAPFRHAFRDDGQACDLMTRRFFDREASGERQPGPGTPVPDPPTSIDLVELCAVANVISFNQSALELEASPSSAVLGSRVVRNLDTYDPFSARVFHAGHAEVTFDDPLQDALEYSLLVVATGRVHHGLPAIGFSVIRGVNAAARPGVLASYAGGTPHRGSVNRSEIQ